MLSKNMAKRISDTLIARLAIGDQSFWADSVVEILADFTADHEGATDEELTNAYLQGVSNAVVACKATVGDYFSGMSAGHVMPVDGKQIVKELHEEMDVEVDYMLEGD